MVGNGVKERLREKMACPLTSSDSSRGSGLRKVWQHQEGRKLTGHKANADTNEICRYTFKWRLSAGVFLQATSGQMEQLTLLAFLDDSPR